MIQIEKTKKIINLLDLMGYDPQNFSRISTVLGGILTLVGTGIDNKYLGYVGGGIALSGPFFEGTFSRLKEIVNRYEDLQHNKKTFGSLIDRVQAIEFALKPLFQEREENEAMFQSQVYYRSLLRMVGVLRAIKELANNVSQLNYFKKYLMANSIKGEYESLYHELDSCVRDLSFAMTITSKEDAKKSKQKLGDDLQEIRKLQEEILVKQELQDLTLDP